VIGKNSEFLKGKEGKGRNVAL